MISARHLVALLTLPIVVDAMSVRHLVAVALEWMADALRPVEFELRSAERGVARLAMRLRMRASRLDSWCLR